MNPEQLDLFPELPQRSASPEPEPATICAHCDHIVGVRFQSRNLFFCAIQRGGRYGKKIRKNAPSCPKFVAALTPMIPHIDGYYGGEYSPGIVRGNTIPREEDE
jgi:hypothetical protein